MIGRWVALVALTWCYAVAAHAQGPGLVHGSVEDETGAVILRARVTLIAVASGAVRTAKGGATGRFAFEDVAAGDYVLHVAAEEFQSVDMPLTVGREGLEPVIVRMQIGLSEEITVSGSRAGSRVNADQNANAMVLSRDFLNMLPVEGGDVLPLISALLAPAASGGNGLSVVVDGVEGDAIDVSAAMIRHLVVNRNPYSSEFRRPGKGRVEIVTNRGARKLRGGGSIAGRSAVFDARNAFAQTKPDDAKRFVDGNLGGPLGDGRTRFFATGSWLQHDESAIVHASSVASGGLVTDNVAAGRRHATASARLDVHLSGQQTVTTRYDFVADAAHNRGVGGLRLREQAYDADEGKHRVQVSAHGVFATVMNDLRGGAEIHHTRVGQPASRPAIVVHGAFIGGPSQTYHENDQRELEVQNIATWFHGIHTVRFGGEGRYRRVHRVEGANFGGTFDFASLDQFARGAPELFRMTQGTPDADVAQPAAFGFVQDEMRLRTDLNVMVGLREDWQAQPGPGASLEPRAAVAWSPRNRQTVVRVGAGTFSDRLSDTALARSVLLDGQRLRDLVVLSPTYPDPFGAAIRSVPPNVVRLASDLRTPELLQASMEVERPLWGGARMTIDYTALRGWHLLRSRDVNPPAGALGLRPDPAFRNIAQLESAAAMRSDALTVSINGRLAPKVTGLVSYVWSKVTDETASVFDLPADSRDVAAERGRADYDRRHRLNVVGTWDAGHGIRVGAVATFASAGPFDITTGFDTNGDGLVHDRPAGVTRNLGNGPGQSQIDLRLAKLVPLRASGTRPDKDANLQVTLDAFNAFNWTTFTNIVGVQTSPFFGLPTAAKPARAIQLTARYKF